MLYSSVAHLLAYGLRQFAVCEATTQTKQAEPASVSFFLLQTVCRDGRRLHWSGWATSAAPLCIVSPDVGSIAFTACTPVVKQVSAHQPVFGRTCSVTQPLDAKLHTDQVIKLHPWMQSCTDV
jgi:hypothetical protein